MSRRILLEQLNGETFELEVAAEMTMTDVKEQVKRMHEWKDELSCDTTVVDLILGDKKVTEEETLKELGLCDGSKVTVVFRNNVVQCSDMSSLRDFLDPEAQQGQLLHETWVGQLWYDYVPVYYIPETWSSQIEEPQCGQ